MKGVRPKIVLSGFYGAGNSGDEAMLRNFYFHIRKRLPTAEILVATEKCGGSWRPPDLHYISAMDRAQAKLCDLLVIGGGGLGVGFGWNLASFAKVSLAIAPKVATIGCSFPPEWAQENIKGASKAMFGLYDLSYARDKDSTKVLGQINVGIKLGTDIAIDLPEECIHRSMPEDYVVLVVREVGENLAAHMRSMATLILKYLAENYNVVILPFCKEDVKFTKFLDVGETPVVVTDNPQHHKYIINRAKAVVTIGRYHPLVYATEQGVPAIAFSWPAGGSKIDNWMAYLGTSNYCINKLVKKVENVYVDRLNLFTSKLTHLLKNRAIYRKKMLLKHAHHVALNNKQFDDLVGLIK